MLCFAIAPATIHASDAEDVTIAQAAPAEPNEDAPAQPAPGEAVPPSPGGSAAPPPGVEVMHVRGAGTQIETEVPSSLTLFDASTIEALGAQDISDLSRVTPNVNIVQPGATQATFFVRGVGLSDFSSNAAGAVTIFQDDVSLNAPAIQTGALFDIEGVEVMRGPQGSGPYRNASAGAIRVRSRRPSGNYSADLRSSFGRYDTVGDKGARESLIQDYEGALEAPIVPGFLSTRLAFRLNEADPYKTNGCANAPPISQRTPQVPVCNETAPAFPFQSGFRSIVTPGLPKYVQDKHSWAARGTLRFHPEDTDYDFLLNAHGSRLDQDSTVGQAIGDTPLGGAINTNPAIRYAGRDANGYVDPDVLNEYDRVCGSNRQGGPGNPGRCPNQLALIQFSKKIAEGRPLDEKPYRGDYDRIGLTTRDTWGAFLSGEVGVTDDIKISGLTSYDGYKRTQDGDTDFTPLVVFELVQEDEAWQMYHQLQAEGELASEPVQWNVGAYYMREDLSNDGTFFLGGPIRDAQGLPAGFSRRSYDQLLDSLGVWGGFAWDFADDFTLEGGVRYNWEKKTFDIDVMQRVFLPEDFSGSKSETWQTPTGQLVLTYHIDSDNSLFAKYSRGFKAGHFNSLATRTVTPADEEYNDSWEAGLNASLFNRMVSLRSSFFYYRYTNYQVFLFLDSADAAEPPVLTILNAKQAENFGAEAEGMIMPLMGWTPPIISGLRLSGNFSWLHGEYIDFGITKRFLFGSTGIFNVPIDYSGNQLQNAPRYKASGTAEWTFDLGRFGFIIPRYDVNWSDDVFFDPNEGHGSIDPTGGPALIDYAVGQKAFTLHNVRLAYRTPSSTVEVAGWIRNVEDRVYKNYAFDATGFSRLVINFPGEPRTIGVDISVTF